MTNKVKTEGEFGDIRVRCDRCGEILNPESMDKHKCSFWKRNLKQPEFTMASLMYLIFSFEIYFRLGRVFNLWQKMLLFAGLITSLWIFDKSFRKFLE